MTKIIANSMNYHEITHLNRKMVKVVDKLLNDNGIQSQNTVASKIHTLSKKRVVPKFVSTCMHLIRVARNSAEHEDHLPDSTEAAVIRSSLGVITIWKAETMNSS